MPEKMTSTGIENPELKAAYFRDFSGEHDSAHLDVLKRKIPEFQKSAAEYGAYVTTPPLSPYNQYPYAVRISSREKLTVLLVLIIRKLSD